MNGQYRIRQTAMQLIDDMLTKRGQLIIFSPFPYLYRVECPFEI